MGRTWIHSVLLAAGIGICGYSAVGIREVYYYNPDPLRALDVALVYGALGVCAALMLLAALALLIRHNSRAAGLASGLASLLLLGCGYLLYFLNKFWLSGRPWYTPTSLIASGLIIVGFLFLIFLAAKFLRRMRPEFSFFEKWVIPVLPLALVVLLAIRFSAHVSFAAPQPVKGPAPNIVIVVLDTVGRDFVSAYGYQLPTTPVFDRVASEGILFADAQAVSCWTLPSVVGLLSSALPGKDVLPGATGAVLKATTLPEVLARSGYLTIGVGSNPHVAGPFGVFQRFEKFYDGQPAWRRALAMTTLGDVLNRFSPVQDADLARVAVDQIVSARRPYFLYIHLMGAHAPYRTPRGWLSPFPIPAVEREIDFPSPEIGITEKEREHLVHRYAALIRYTDEQLGRIVAAIDRSGATASTLLVITADHGEEFGEHGDWTHGRTLYREMLNVPLVMRWPARIPAGVTFQHVVSHLDVAPTILSLALPEREVPQTWMGNRLSVLRAPFQAPDSGVPSEIPPYQSLTTVQFKYIRDNKNSKEWLFDRKRDFAETRNLASEMPEVVALLRQQLDAQMARSTSALAPSNEISPEIEERLRSLGYIQ